MNKQLDIFNTESIKTHPFSGRSVHVKGFDNNTRKRLSEYIRSNGGMVVDTISKNSHYIIADDASPEDSMERYQKLRDDGYHIRLLRPADMEQIYNGNYEPYMTEKTLPKQLNLTAARIRKWVLKSDLFNPYSGKEIYLGGGLSGNPLILAQMFGNYGAFANLQMYDDTDMFLISDNTLKELENGRKDETILAIEKFYNDSKSIYFTYNFIIESEFLEYVRNRCERTQDKVTSHYYNVYLNNGNK